MKSILDFFKWFIIGAWFILAVFSTVCLISYNDYKVSVINNTSIIIMDNTDLEPTFMKNDVVFVSKASQKDYQVGDYIFFYSNNRTDTNFINYGVITEIQPDESAEYGYYIGSTKISYSDIIGKANGSKVYHKVGAVLRVMESRWGFMFLVCLPTLFALVYEVYNIVIEVKTNTKEEKE
jgi:signal peptidase I